ncbi:MAG: hypothetical protein VKK04_01225 [Synechococcales bacterium]|nr:hypothetical protein [Synechococcales bacterium]
MNPQEFHPSGNASASPDPASASITFSPPPPAAGSPPIEETQRLSSTPEDSGVTAFGAWFLSLPSIGQLLVLVAGAIALLGTISILLEIIAWSIQLVLLGTVMFLVYRLFFHKKEAEGQTEQPEE